MKLFLSYLVALHWIGYFFVNGQSCGIVDWGETFYGNVPDDLTEDLFLGEKESFGVAFVNARTRSGTREVLTQLKTNSSGQFISFYMTKLQTEDHDILREEYFVFHPQFRCQDGSYVEDSPENYLNFVDANNRAPEFAENSYTFFIPLPWPNLIPITQSNGIIVRDRDYSRENAQLSFTFGRPELLTVQSSTLPSNSFSYDYKVDLFVTPSITAGNHTFALEASDGVHRTISRINLVVTEVTCRALRDPVFGNAAVNPTIVYKAILPEYSQVGDSVALRDGLKRIEAFGPDEQCQIDLTVNVDYLDIDSKGNLIVTRKLTVEEMENLKPYANAEITAIVRGTSRMSKVPLILSSI